jgi:hypothetical protein
VPAADRDALALHRAAVAHASDDQMHAILVDHFGPELFGLDALIGDAAPRVLADVAQEALTSLAQRAVDHDDAVTIGAVDRFWSTIEHAAVDVDIAPAQEVLCRGLAKSNGSDELLALASRLGINPAAVLDVG